MDIKENEKIFKAFANKRRLSIVIYLRTKKEATVGEIAKKINLSFRSTSRHLVLLSNAGILDRRQHHLLVFYKIDPSLPENIKIIINSII